MASKLKGAPRVKRLMRRLPDAAQVEIVHALRDTGPKLAREMQSRAPRRTGALRAGITWKLFPKTLRLQAGLIGTKRGRARLFYGWILEYGRKGGTVKAKRRTKSGGYSVYAMRVSRIAPMRFVTGNFHGLRTQLQARLRGIWGRILSRASGGSDE